jgi:hypothetical protein
MEIWNLQYGHPCKNSSYKGKPPIKSPEGLEEVPLTNLGIGNSASRITLDVDLIPLNPSGEFCSNPCLEQRPDPED